MRKRLHALIPAGEHHWVGDGFPVQTLFSHATLGSRAGPFLLLDWAAPHEFAASSSRPRGVGPHPHRGFETVTVVYSGAVDHRDSHGGGGSIGPGDVQWMTAASGLVHEEFHSAEFTQRGGTLEMVQLWVNLPAADKRRAPRYQKLSAAQIPTVTLQNGAGRVRVLAGSHSGASGPAQTFTPISLLDVQLRAGGHVEFELPAGHATLLLLRRGEIALHDAPRIGSATLTVFGRVARGEGNETLRIDATIDSELLLLDGAPIDEPVVAYGPFVMNTREEIAQAFADYQAGRMGQIVTGS